MHNGNVEGGLLHVGHRRLTKKGFGNGAMSLYTGFVKGNWRESFFAKDFEKHA
jgi:hypothetical protein